VEALKNGGKVVHPSLGVIGSGSGARIAALQPGGSGAQSDLREGDLVLKVGGLEIESFEELTALVANANVGEDVKLLVKRGSETKTITVKLLAQ
jgi:serine protease Do